MIRAGITGAIGTILLMFPLASLTALVYRFPIPFGGYASGIDAAPYAAAAVAFYGIEMGGFVVLGALGFLAGAVAYRRARAGVRSPFRLTIVFSLVLGLGVVLTLAVLDKIIGPW